jgi:hypothetical protein
MPIVKADGTCVLEGCSNPLGPDALEFEHRGRKTGGICEICLASVPAVRILFVKDKDGFLKPEEMVIIDKLTT